MTNKCAGLLGLLFGHKFIKSKGGRVYSCNACYRCGRVKGT